MFAGRNMIFAGAVAFDADALAYIDAIEAAGATVSAPQKLAIDTFVVAEKSASRWDGVKRLYLPVWGIAAANAICMKSLTSGTFVGGVTHAAGYVQGNGTTGYFDFGVSLLDVGASLTSAALFNLIYADGGAGSLNKYSLGSSNAAVSHSRLFHGSSSTNWIGGTSNSSIAAQNRNGVYLINRTSSTSLISYIRRTAGLTTSTTNTTLLSVEPPDFNVYAMGLNLTGALSLPTIKLLGVYGMGLGVSDPSAFTLNLKTLWETVTGLTLP